MKKPKKDLFWKIITIIELIILFYSSGIINEIKQDNTELKANNEKLTIEINYLTDLNKLFIENYSKGLLKNYNLTNQIKDLEKEKKELIEELSKEYKTQNQLKETIKQAKKERGLINPTYQELKDFIRTDKTNYNDWTEEYDCTEFSNEFILNFKNKGFFSCPTEIDYNCGSNRCGHIIVAVNTTDKGLIYLEPQTDKIIKDLRINKNYCNLADWNCNWKITKISSCFKF